MLGDLLIRQGQDAFQKMISVGYLGFTPDSVYYCADYEKMDRDTLCYVKLSDFPILRSVRPAIAAGTMPMVPEELIAACVQISTSVTQYGSGNSEVDRIFGKLRKFLTDEAAQNASLPADVQSEIASHEPCDCIPNGAGTFGRSLQNPIPVNGPLGEVLYLSLIRLNHVPVLFHRLGSFAPIDVYEIVALDGTAWDILYLTPYYPRRSRMAPSGYVIERDSESGRRIFGTNARVEPFPYALYEAVRSFTKRGMGLPLPNRKIREALMQYRFVAPEAHTLRIDELVRSRIHLAATEDNMTG